MFRRKAREAQKTIDSQREMISQQDNRLIEYSKRLSKIENDLGEVRKERNELKTQVREQTEADLLMVSWKIIDEMKKGTSKEAPEVVGLQQEQARLRSARAAMGGYGYNYGSQGMIGVMI